MIFANKIVNKMFDKSSDEKRYAPADHQEGHPVATDPRMTLGLSLR